MGEREWIGIGCSALIGLGLMLTIGGRNRKERRTGWAVIACGMIMLGFVIYEMYYR